MIFDRKVVFVSLIDNQSTTPRDLKISIWFQQKMIKSFLRNQTCIMGRKTFEMTQWKGPKSWVLTTDQTWRRKGVGRLSDIEDIRLHTEGPIYILGGSSLFQQFEEFVDEIHLFVVNKNEDDGENWLRLKLTEWKAVGYLNRIVWSYAHLIKNFV